MVAAFVTYEVLIKRIDKKMLHIKRSFLLLKSSGQIFKSFKILRSERCDQNPQKRR